MKHAELVKTRSKCISRQVGAILVLDGRLLSSGFNGTPSGYTNCVDGGCQRCKDRVAGVQKSGENLSTCKCIHGELNAILFAAKNGISINKSTLYTTTSPCLDCCKAIANSGIKTVVYNEIYDAKALEFLRSCKIDTQEVTY